MCLILLQHGSDEVANGTQCHSNSCDKISSFRFGWYFSVFDHSVDRVHMIGFKALM